MMASKNRKTPTSLLAKLVKELRGNTSQREFAKLVGTSYTTIQDWEKQVRLPSSKNLQRLSELKGWTQTELMNYLFSAGASHEQPSEDSVANILASVENFSPEQMKLLNEYLEDRMRDPKTWQSERSHP